MPGSTTSGRQRTLALLLSVRLEPVFGNPTAADDHGQIPAILLQQREVGEGIAVDNQKIGMGACGDAADLALHAAQRGASGLRGRTQPALLAAMLGRRVAFTQPASTVVHSRDEALVNAFLSAQGFFNGLAGEHWNRLAGWRFE